jgi:hypothetical protein
MKVHCAGFFFLLLCTYENFKNRNFSILRMSSCNISVHKVLHAYLYS